MCLSVRGCRVLPPGPSFPKVPEKVFCDENKTCNDAQRWRCDAAVWVQWILKAWMERDRPTGQAAARNKS